MKLKASVLSTTAAFAGLLMLGATALAQGESGSYAAPQSGSPSQPSTAEPGQSAQPYGPADQDAPSSAANNQQMTSPSQTSSPSQMSSPSSSSSTMSASEGEPLTHVKNAKTTLASASVQDSSGQSVGQVVDVHMSKHGTPTTIDVSLQSSAGGQPKTIAIKANKLRYDQSSNTLKADLTATDMQSLPTASGM
jgi:hypothetical protein